MPDMKCGFVSTRGPHGAWVPYKTLIGPAIGNRVLIGSRGTRLYAAPDCIWTSRMRAWREAVNAATDRARAIITAHGMRADLVPIEVIVDPQVAMIEASLVN